MEKKLFIKVDYFWHVDLYHTNNVGVSCSILKISYIIVHVNDNIKICNNRVKFECEVSKVNKVNENIMLDDLKKKNIKKDYYW